MQERRADCQWPQLLLIQLLTAAHVQTPPSTCLHTAAKVITAIKSEPIAKSITWYEKNCLVSQTEILASEKAETIVVVVFAVVYTVYLLHINLKQVYEQSNVCPE